MTASDPLRPAELLVGAVDGPSPRHRGGDAEIGRTRLRRTPNSAPCRGSARAAPRRPRGMAYRSSGCPAALVHSNESTRVSGLGGARGRHGQVWNTASGNWRRKLAGGSSGLGYYRAFLGDRLADRWRDFLREPANRGGVGAPEHERADSLGQCEVGELLDPQLRRALQKPTGVAEFTFDVVDAAYGFRRPVRLVRGAVDDLARGRQTLRRQERRTHHPTVSQCADNPQHPRLISTQPEVDRMRRCGPRGGATQLVVLAVEVDRGTRNP